jgi:predicted MPP superfamily phosphohydrolase
MFLVLSTFFLCFCLGIYAIFIEPFRVKITQYDLKSNQWQNDTALNVAVIADPHMIWPWMSLKHMQRIVEKTNAIKPDLILLLGDYVATHPFGLQISPSKAVEVFENFKAGCGVYAVLGNHDWHPDVGWPSAFSASQIPILRNQAISLQCHNQSFWIAGLEDLWWQKASIKETKLQITNNDPVILMMHNPDSFPDVPKDIMLTISGHTHGGQIRLPWIGALPFVIPSKYGLRYAYGHIQEDGKNLVVSGGLGNSGIPARFLRTPEIVLIHVTK